VISLLEGYERPVRPSLTYVNRALSGRALLLLKHLKTAVVRPS
jgi:hypothetical protein